MTTKLSNLQQYIYYRQHKHLAEIIFYALLGFTVSSLEWWYYIDKCWILVPKAVIIHQDPPHPYPPLDKGALIWPAYLNKGVIDERISGTGDLHNDHVRAIGDDCNFTHQCRTPGDYLALDRWIHRAV